MVFSSTIFLFGFLPIILAGYYLIKDEYRNTFLLIASLLFYAWGEPKFILILCSSIVVNYIAAILVDKYRESKVLLRIVLIGMLIFNLTLLFIFKYMMFVIENINLLTGANLTIPSITLPLGISFFTFQAISYVLDVYFETAKPQKSLLNVGLYIALFPQLVAGPIVRYNSIAEQIDSRQETIEKFSDGVKRFIIGLAKKIILANAFATIADKAFETGVGELSVSLAWLGIFTYCLQLYYDFSGYSDMAIGLGKMFGFEFEENFNYPYIAKSAGEFWRRWHISLGTWLRDYLYTPTFRKMMKSKSPITKKKISIQNCDIIALFVTWILCGIWHGANWTFVAFGLYYAIFIISERMRDNRRKKIAKAKKIPKRKETKLESVMAHIYTLIVVTFGQLLFRATSIQQAINYIGSMFGLNNNDILDQASLYYLKTNFIMIIIGIIFAMPVIRKVREMCLVNDKLYSIKKIVSPILYILLFILGIAYTVTSTYNPFIYFNF